ncbi:MAG TPA: aminopeptidase [Anaerolineales bacterium]|nr:aminopeptidase [Anaerolineales bacterium]
MTDYRVENLAKVIVEYCLSVKPKDRVAVTGGTLSEPLMLAIQREVLRAGGYPYLFPSFSGAEYIRFSESNDDQLDFVSPVAKMVLEEFECLASLYSQANTRALTNIDPAKQSRVAKAEAGVMKRYMERSAAGEFNWVVTMFPTNAHAQDAEMSLAEFEDYVYSTMYVDRDDPVREWRRIHDEQQRYVDWLAGKEKVLVKGPNVDLHLSIKDRAFINADGVNNMPSGEIFTSPIEDSVEGWIRFTYPAIYLGREVEGIELKIEKGKVVKATAEKNEGFLLEMLEVDEGARYVGEFAIGTNKRINRFIKNILYDEKIGGTIHMAIGSGFEEVGGKNKSGIHWDMICDMCDGGQIFVDDELFYESGDFKV